MRQSLPRRRNGNRKNGEKHSDSSSLEDRIEMESQLENTRTPRLEEEERTNERKVLLGR